jgi:hypothetical protein
MKPALLLLALLVSILGSTVLAAESKDRVETDIPFGPGGYLYLKNRSGELRISSWDEERVHIVAVKRIQHRNDRDDETLLKDIRIDIVQKEDEILIETKGPESDDSFIDRFFGRHKYAYTVDYEIKVPKQIDLNIENTNGDIEVLQINGRIRLETTNGNIDAREIEGLAKCNSTNGSIRAEFTEVPEGDRLSFKTTNGSISVHFPEDFGGMFDLKTVNGTINSDFPIQVEGHWLQKQFHGQVYEGTCDLHCSTVNGSIDLYHTD